MADAPAQEAAPIVPTQPAAPAAAPTSAPVNMSDQLTTIVNNAPELASSPGLAVGVAASGGDPVVRAQVVARAAQSASDNRAVDSVNKSSGGILGSALNWFGNSVSHAVGDVAGAVKTGVQDVAKPVGTLLNKPLSWVQHEYRYLHDVEARHGMLAAVAEGIGIAAGGVAGGLTAGPAGIALGAEAATGLEGQLFYRDSWDRTTDGNTYEDPHTHQPVSLGRDVASVLGLRPGTESFKIASGSIDGVFDMGVNIPGLGVLRDVHSAEGAGGALGKVFQGYGVMDGEKVDHAFHEGESVGLTSPFKRMMQHVAGKSAGDITATIPNLPEVIVNRLSKTTNADEAMQVFKDAAGTQELAFINRLPTLSRTRAVTSSARAAAGNLSMENNLAQNAVVGPGRWFHRFSPIATSMDQVGKTSMGEMDPMEPGFLKAMYQQALYTENRRTAIDVVNNVAQMPEAAQRIVAYRNLQMRTLMNMADMRLPTAVGGEEQATKEALAKAFPDPTHKDLADIFSNPTQANRAFKELNTILDQGMFGKDSLYGFDDKGRNVSLIRDRDSGTWKYAAAITDSQTGKLTMMDFGQYRRIGKALKNADSIFTAQDREDAESFLGKLRIQVARGDYAGRIDEQGYRAITQGLFKPLVLLTPSYAMHISLAEMIPNALRLGVVNLTRSALAMMGAKLGIREGDLHLSEEALERFTKNRDASLVKTPEALAGLAWRMVTRGMKIAPDRISDAMQKRLELAVQYIEGQGGETIDPALISGAHGFGDTTDRADTATTVLRHAVDGTPMRGSGKFAQYANTNEKFVDKWGENLNAHYVKDPGMQVAARTMSQELKRGTPLEGDAGHNATEIARRLVANHIRTRVAEDPLWAGNMLRNDPRFTAFEAGIDPPVEWDAADEHANIKVQALRGIARGQDGTMHTDILDHIAEGNPINSHDLDRIPPEQRPMHVAGEEQIPSANNVIQRIANNGFVKVLNPMVNFLSRQPYAFAEYERQMGQMDDAVAKGIISADQQDVLARTRAAIHGVRFIHNLNDRTQWTVTMRNWAPFWFAQEQAYRRMGRLLAEDPVAFRKYQLMIANVGNVGTILSNGQGSPYFVMPHTGWFSTGARVLGALSILQNPLVGSSPVGLGWNLNASSVIFPLSATPRPDIGPLIGIPTQVIANFFAEHAGPVLASQVSGAENAILGASASQSVWSQFVPNTVLDRLLTAAVPAFDERSFDSTFMQTLQTLDYEHLIPPPNSSPQVMQAFLDRWRNQTRIMYAAKALVGAVTPVSPEIVVNNFGLPADLTADITKAGSVTAGIQEFLSKHPDATPYTVFQSSNEQGMSLPASVQAENWINQHMADINRYGAAYLALMPTDIPQTYNATVYNEQIAQGLREKLNPETATGPTGNLPSYIEQLYISAGNATVLDKWYPVYKQQIAGMSGQEKYQAELNWQQSLANFGAQNPIWYAWWNSDQKASQRTQAVIQMQQMYANGDEPKTPTAEKVRGLLQDYETYKGQLTAGEQDSFAGQTQSSINANWQQYLESLGADNPDLRPVIDTLFLTLPTATTTTGG